MLVTILCNALMALLGIGLKVATLPVIALGVGVGVDYGVYLYEHMQHEIRHGLNLPLSGQESSLEWPQEQEKAERLEQP